MLGDADEQTIEHAARLREFDAPPEIARWAEEHETFDDAWEACPSGRHRLWLAAIAGAPVETIAEAAAAGFFAAVEGSPADERVARAVERCVAAADAETAGELAERCEREMHALPSYREHDGSRPAMLARAAAHVCRAFEALRSAEGSMESDRLMRARAMAGYMGGGVHAFLPAEAGPATILATLPKSVARALLVAAVASAAESASVLAALLGPDATLVDDAIWDALTPE